MLSDIGSVRIGLVLSMLTLMFGIGMGVLFGVNEEGVKGYIEQGIAANQERHDDKSASKIWRYAQRAHFHATGVGAFALAMVILIAAIPMSRALKQVTSILIGVGSLYALAWFSMFWLAPALGRHAAHDALVTQLITKATVACLSLGVLILFIHLLTGVGSAAPTRSA